MTEMDDSREQELWDRKCEASPRCSCCCRSVYPHNTFVETDDNRVYCEMCFRIIHTEDLEL